MARLKGIRHVFFDFDDTLWDFQRNSAVVLRDLFAQHRLENHLGVAFDDFCSAYREINLGLWSLYYRRQVTKEEMRARRFVMAFERFGYANDALAERISDEYLEITPRGMHLREDCLSTLDYLREKYQLHVITNGFSTVQDIKIDGCGLRHYFRNIIISEAHGLVKPETAIFRLAERFAKAEPGECVMVGDSYESDIAGALAAGWQAIHFAEPGDESHAGPRITGLAQLLKML